MSLITKECEQDDWERWPGDIPPNMPLYLSVYYFMSLGFTLYFKYK